MNIAAPTTTTNGASIGAESVAPSATPPDAMPVPEECDDDGMVQDEDDIMTTTQYIADLWNIEQRVARISYALRDALGALDDVRASLTALEVVRRANTATLEDARALMKDRYHEWYRLRRERAAELARHRERTTTVAEYYADSVEVRERRELGSIWWDVNTAVDELLLSSSSSDIEAVGSDHASSLPPAPYIRCVRDAMNAMHSRICDALMYIRTAEWKKIDDEETDDDADVER
jgi:hypothetical protein